LFISLKEGVRGITANSLLLQETVEGNLIKYGYYFVIKTFIFLFSSIVKKLFAGTQWGYIFVLGVHQLQKVENRCPN
jgi:hypothetical protein